MARFLRSLGLVALAALTLASTAASVREGGRHAVAIFAPHSIGSDCAR